MKDTTPFGFYYLDREYIEAMHTAENPHVPNADYEDSGRARKFYCGPVMNQDGVDYFVPVSHEIKDKMEILGSRANGFAEYYGIPLMNKDKEMTGNLDFRYMLPCVDNRFLTPINPDNDLGAYGREQAHFCTLIKNRICKNAQETYNNIQSGEYKSLTESSVNFEMALDDAWTYLDKVEEREKMTAKMAIRSSIANEMISNVSPSSSSNDFDRKF